MDETVDHRGGDNVVAEDLAPATEGHVRSDEQRGAFIPAGHELEEQVRGFGFEGDVTNQLPDSPRPVVTDMGSGAMCAPDVFRVSQVGEMGIHGMRSQEVNRGGSANSITMDQVMWVRMGAKMPPDARRWSARMYPRVRAANTSIGLAVAIVVSA